MMRYFPQNYLWLPKCVPRKNEAVFKGKKDSFYEKNNLDIHAKHRTCHCGFYNSVA